VKRADLLIALAERIVSVRLARPIRVAIDGVDAAGKTTLADELAEHLSRAEHQVIRASVDGFHNPRAVRYQRGADSPEGYYRDSFDHDALLNLLLLPLGEGGSLRFHRAVFDFRVDAEISVSEEVADPNAILLFDGVFLLRPELREYWDFSIYVKASFDVTLGRVLVRDNALFGSETETRRRYGARYIPGQQLYLAEAQPEAFASVIVDNNDVRNPRLIHSGNG
jgi:uridine kinase